MTNQTILQTVTDHQEHVFQLAMTLDRLDDVQIVLTRLKEVERSRFSGAYHPMGAAVEFITRIITDEKAKEILEQMRHTVKQALLAELFQHGYTEEDVRIASFPQTFYLNPSFEVLYKNQRILSFSVASNHYVSLMKYWAIWSETGLNTVNRNIERTEAKDTKSKVKQLRDLYAQKEKLEQAKQLQDSLKDECHKVHEVVARFLETFGYQPE